MDEKITSNITQGNVCMFLAFVLLMALISVANLHLAINLNIYLVFFKSILETKFRF